MKTTAGQNEPNIRVDPARTDETHYRPIRLIGLLLILQVVGLVGIGAYEVTRVDWDQIDPDQPETVSEALLEEAIEAVLFVVLFLPPAFFMFLAGLSFILLKRKGWLLAAIAQGLSLGASLWLYSESIKPIYIYPIMLYCILMIMYLNSHDVRVVFHSRRVPEKPGLETTGES